MKPPGETEHNDVLKVEEPKEFEDKVWKWPIPVDCDALIAACKICHYPIAFLNRGHHKNTIKSQTPPNHCDERECERVRQSGHWYRTSPSLYVGATCAIRGASRDDFFKRTINISGARKVIMPIDSRARLIDRSSHRLQPLFIGKYLYKEILTV